MFVTVGCIRKAHREYTRNPVEGREKVHNAGDPLVWERSGGGRKP
jgi:hypothetical protein